MSEKDIPKMRKGIFIPNESFEEEDSYEEIPQTEEEKIKDIGKKYCPQCKEKKDCIRKWIDDPLDGGEPFWVSMCSECGHPINGITVIDKQGENKNEQH